MKKSIYKISLFVFVMLLFTKTLVAQDPPGFGEGVDDTTVTGPISGLVFLGIVIGAVFGYRKLKE